MLVCSRASYPFATSEQLQHCEILVAGPKKIRSWPRGAMLQVYIEFVAYFQDSFNNWTTTKAKKPSRLSKPVQCLCTSAFLESCYAMLWKQGLPPSLPFNAATHSRVHALLKNVNMHRATKSMLLSPNRVMDTPDSSPYMVEQTIY